MLGFDNAGERNLVLSSRHLNRSKRRTLWLFYAVVFVVYVPVMLLRSDLPLLVLDLLLLISLVEMGVQSRRPVFGLIGGSRMVTVAVLLYYVAVSLGILWGLLEHNVETPISVFRGVRTALFGVVFLVVSSMWFTTIEAVRKFLRIFLFGCFLSALYGFKQLFFGLTSFELERLAQMGSSLNELQYLGRIRVGSSFGDPATFGFMMMLGALLAPSMLSDSFSSKWFRHKYLYLSGLLITAAFISLMRGIVVALGISIAIGFILWGSRPTGFIWRIFIVLALSGAFVITLNLLVLNIDFAQSENAMLRSIGSVVESVWSALPSIVPLEELSSSQQRLRTISLQTRQSYAEGAINFLVEHPLGVGVGSLTAKSNRFFAEVRTIDIFYLRLAVELGWFGLLTFLFLFVSVPWVAYRQLQEITSPHLVALGRHLLIAWVAAAIALLANNYLETEITSAVFWTLGGISLNLKTLESEAIRKGLAA